MKPRDVSTIWKLVRDLLRRQPLLTVVLLFVIIVMPGLAAIAMVDAFEALPWFARAAPFELATACVPMTLYALRRRLIRHRIGDLPIMVFWRPEQ